MSRGTVMAYHRRNFGWAIAELVRRIDGRPFNQFLQEEVTGPLAMNDTYVGLPPSLEGRVSSVHAMEDCDRPEMVCDYNRPEVHQAVHPAGCGIATARDLARIYAMMERGGALDGVRILKPETVAEVTKLQVEGIDGTLNQYIHRSLGMALGDPSHGLFRNGGHPYLRPRWCRHDDGLGGRRFGSGRRLFNQRLPG